MSKFLLEDIFDGLETLETAEEVFAVRDEHVPETLCFTRLLLSGEPCVFDLLLTHCWLLSFCDLNLIIFLRR